MKNITLLLTCFFLMCGAAQSQSQFWGMSVYGGNGGGTIFITDNQGQNPLIVHEFLENLGSTPLYNQMCEAPNGTLYGMVNSGGEGHHGVIYKYDPTSNTYQNVYDFYNTLNGAQPWGGLIMANNSKLYGMTMVGGIYNCGVLFEYNPANATYTKMVDFDDTIRGSNPAGTLLEAANGKLYGMTKNGGAFGDGVIFEFDPDNGSFSIKHEFNHITDGKSPMGSLIQATNGKLYGMTYYGGADSDGIIFEYDIASDNFIVKHQFNGSNGRSPIGNLLQATNGKFYGLTPGGGSDDIGVLFEFDAGSNSFSLLVDFDYYPEGSYPSNSLIQATNGILYGMTSGNDGTLFAYNIGDTAIDVKHYFENHISGCMPMGNLIQSQNGNIYGLARGGPFSAGLIFEFNPTIDTFKTKIFLNSGINGSKPMGGLTLASNGKLYGMTNHGGKSTVDDPNEQYGCGVLFELDPVSGVYTKKVDFKQTLGCEPDGTMINGANGNLYGTTRLGGAYNCGVIFEYDPGNEMYTIKHHFTGDTNGGYPHFRLVQASNGNLYGVSCCNGLYEGGVLFEYDITNHLYSVKFHFSSLSGENPYGGGLVEAPNGKLYGLASGGGANYSGTLFEYDPLTTQCIKKVDFEEAITGRPDGSLVLAQNGKLYGVNRTGGIYNQGILFEYTPGSNIISIKVDFLDSISGETPFNRLMEASDGLLYGQTMGGGDFSGGVIFAYDPVSELYTKQTDLDYSLGYGDFNHLIEVGSSFSIIENQENGVSVYPNPSDGIFMVSLPDNSSNSIEVINILGELVFKRETSGELMTKIDLRNNTPGLYLMVLKNKSGTFCTKLMVE